MNPLIKIRNFVFKPIHAIKLRAFTCGVAFTFFIYMIERYKYGREWLTEYGYHIPHHLQYWYAVVPVPLLTDKTLPIFGVILFASTLAVMFNFFTRSMAFIVFLCCLYIKYADSISSFTLNILYILIFLIIALSPRAQKFFDPKTQKEVYLQSAWPVRILQVTILLQYFCAGLSKCLYGDWLKNPDVLWSQLQGLYCTEACAIILNVTPKAVISIMMYSALLFELCGPFLFLFKKTRAIGMIWGLSFQLIVALTMHQLIYFSLQILCFYILFFEDEQIIDFVRRIKLQLQKLKTKIFLES